MLSLVLWWKFLVEADLITTDISTAKTTRYTLSDEAFDDAKKTLQQFLVERDRTGLYPIDNKYQNDAIQLFNDYRSANKPKLALIDKLNVSNGNDLNCDLEYLLVKCIDRFLCGNCCSP